ncbi:MAG TPA: DUF4340 domain-containing protein [Kofleriaceae bacterium]|nr:DUF4340 domain-containing protein [Kofleriaceae bacterium]
MDSRRWLIALAALAAALAAALVVDLAGGGRVSPGGRILADWDPSRVAAVHIERPGQPPVVVERDGATWRLTAPVAAPADPLAVADLLGTLEILSARRRAEGAVADPVLSVTVTPSGRTPVTLDLAADSGRTDRVWLSRRGEDRRALIDGYQLRALDLAADDLRERRPFRGRLAGATRIAVGGAVLEGTPWRIGGVRADPDRVAAVIAALERMRAVSFLASAPNGVPTLTIAVAGKAGASEVKVRGDCQGGGSAATTPLGPACLADDEVRALAGVAGDDGFFIDPRLLAASPDQVTRVRVSAGERSIEVARADQPDVVRDWAARFTTAADRTPIPAADLPVTGMVEVDTEAGREEIAIVRAPGGRPAARRAGEPVAFPLDDPAAADPSPDSFRSLDLLTADPTEVVSLRRGPEHVERGEILEEWRALSPPGRDADPEAAAAIAQAVATLRAVRVAPRRSRGFGPPLAVELAPPPGESAAVTRRVHLADGPGAACTARLDDDPVAFELAPATCAALRRPLVRR